MAFTNPPAWTTEQNPFTNMPNFNNQVGSVDSSGNLPFQNLDPATLQALQGLGWTGGNPVITSGGSGGNQDMGPTPGSSTLSPGFQAWMLQNGLTGVNGTSGNSSDFAIYGPNSTGAQSGVVGNHQLTNTGFNSNPYMMAALAAGLGGSLAAGALGGGVDAAQAAAAASDAGGGSIASGGLTSAAGGTGATLGATGGTLGTVGSTLGSVGSAAGSLLGGMSGSQLGGLVGAAAGLLGNKTGLNSSSDTTTKQVDPRVAQYIYGADGNSGLLGGANALYQQQMATGGLNPLQQQGIASQQAVLNDPNYTSGFNAMKQTGMGLLSAPQAGNPFTNGQRSLSPQSPQSLMQVGQAQIPMGQQFVSQLGPKTGFQPVQPGLLGSR